MICTTHAPALAGAAAAATGFAGVGFGAAAGSTAFDAASGASDLGALPAVDVSASTRFPGVPAGSSVFRSGPAGSFAAGTTASEAVPVRRLVVAANTSSSATAACLRAAVSAAGGADAMSGVTGATFGPLSLSEKAMRTPPRRAMPTKAPAISFARPPLSSSSGV